MIYNLLAILSLGLLLPLAKFRLEKYMADRSYFGETAVTQGGEWKALYAYVKPFIYCIIVVVLAIFTPFNGVLKFALFLIAFIGIMIALVNFQVQSFGYLLRHKKIGPDVEFFSTPSTGSVIKIVLVGGLLITLVSIAITVIFSALALGPEFLALTGGDFDTNGLGVVSFLISVFGYFALLLILGALNLVWITQRVLAHYVTSTGLTNFAALDKIRQSEKSQLRDAEGFADALDVGGAI